MAYFQKVFPNIEVVVFDIDSLPWAGADALPAKEAFWYVVPNREFDRLGGRYDAFMEAFEGGGVLHKIVDWLAPSSVRGVFKD